MDALIKMGLSLGLFVVLLRLRVRIGISMLGAAVALAAMFKVTPVEICRLLVMELQGETIPFKQTAVYLFVSLSLLLLGVNVIGAVMQEVGVSARLINAMHGIFRSRRFALAALPLIMGMLPTPGGIMLSAPMVRDLGDSIGLPRDRQAAINFFFRHQWESVWPLFPAVPLVSGIFGVTAFSVVSHNILISVSGIASGVIFLLLVGMPPKQKNAAPGQRRFAGYMVDFLHAFWPIALTAVLFAGFDLPPAVGIILSIFGLLIMHKVPKGRWPAMFKAAKEPDLVLLVFSALCFMLILKAGGAIPEVVGFFADVNLPPLVIIFVLPFVVGFMSGVTMPTVAITFPFLKAFIGTGDDTAMPLVTLAFTGVMCGLFLTPVHLCLPLSAGYFKTPLSRIIVKMIAPTSAVAAVVIAVTLLR